MQLLQVFITKSIILKFEDVNQRWAHQVIFFNFSHFLAISIHQWPLSHGFYLLCSIKRKSSRGKRRRRRKRVSRHWTCWLMELLCHNSSAPRRWRDVSFRRRQRTGFQQRYPQQMTFMLGKREDREVIVTEDQLEIISKSQLGKCALFTTNWLSHFMVLIPRIHEEAKRT